MKLLLTTIAGVFLVGCGPSVPDISIHGAANRGNIEAVKQHLAAGTDVNAKNEFGSAPLHYAAVNDHKEIIELLIATGADVNARDKGGFTPLDNLIRLDMAEGETTGLLRKHGGMTGEKLKLGTTLLHIAAKEGKMETIELLIASGADVNAKDKNGETPLDYAISTDHTVIADLLRKHDGKTKRELKAAGKPTEPVAEAAQPEPPTAKTPLWKAAMFGEIEPAKQAIADGADVNAKGERGLTPLHFAVVAALDSGDNKVIELLIANGADVNAKDDSGLTPLDSVKRLSEAATLVKRLRELQGKTDDIPVADLLRKHGGKTAKELKAEGK
jgi:ankyrin repeat protein